MGVCICMHTNTHIIIKIHLYVYVCTWVCVNKTKATDCDSGQDCTQDCWIRREMREFPGGPVVRTPSFHCQEPGFNSWLGN